jgi:N-acetylmuramoyl-L-alanine amidase
MVRRPVHWLTLPLMCLLGACASGPQVDPTVDRSYRAVSQDSRIQFIVIHFTTTGFNEALATLTLGGVSSHYLVRDDPVIVYQLVDDSRRAYHAGDSSWQGNTQLNAASIGIEIVNRGNRDGTWQDYRPEQIDAVVTLVKRLAREYGVKPDHIVGHSDIAPQRKVDPGPRFPWKRLADEGLIPWPDASVVAEKRALYETNLPDVEWFQARLERIGYDVPTTRVLDRETRNVIAAFQMKYRPERFNGTPDAETAALLDALTSK